MTSLTLLALGAVTLLLAASRSSHNTASTALTVDTAASGSAVDAARACGWLALAGIAGVLAARGWGRRAVGMVLFLAAAVTAYVLVASELAATWRAVAICGAVMVAVGAVLVVAGGHRWSSLSTRFERDEGPGSGATGTSSAAGSVGSVSGVGHGEAEPIDLWRAIDRGEDPTEPPGSSGGQ